MTLRILPENMDQDADNMEWVSIEGLRVSDLDCFSHPEGIWAGVRQVVARNMEARSEPPTPTTTTNANDVIMVSRPATIKSLRRRVGDLWVSDTYMNARFSRSLAGASAETGSISIPRPEDRFISLGMYENGHKATIDLQSYKLVMVEIDDHELKAATQKLGPTVLPAFAIKHAEIARRALGVLAGAEVGFPFLATYSGSKSFHCLWGLSRPATLSELQILQKSRQIVTKKIMDEISKTLSLEEKNQHRTYMQRVALALQKDPQLSCLPARARPFALIDPAPIFGGTTVARMPCTIPEPGRFPQVGFTFGAPGTVDLEVLLTAANKRVAHEEFIRSMDRAEDLLQDSSRKQFEKLALDEATLSKALGKISRSNGDKWTCRCPVHGDKRESALVKSNGFVWCAVCNADGTDWVARISRDGELILRNS